MAIHDHEPSSRGRSFLWGGLAAGLLFLAFMLTHGFGLLQPSDKASGQPDLMTRQGEKIFVPVGSALRDRLSVSPAQLRPVNDKLLLPAVVESDPARTVAILTPLSGRVVALDVALGDRVVRGQPLAVIDSPDLAQAYDDNEKAGDSARLTAKNLERQAAQNQLGVLSDRDFDQAKSDQTQAAAEYARTQARLAMLGVPPTKPSSARLLIIASPLSGSVTALSVAKGALINDPTQALMTVADLSTIWVTAMVSEKDMAEVVKNQPAEVNFTAYPDRPVQAKVLFVADVVEPDSHRNKIRIALANADYRLKPNMFATVTLAGPARLDVVLPSSALLMNNDRTSVFVATAPWTFERRTVVPRLEEGTSVAIRSGLKADEQVVIKGGILLND